MADVGEVVKGFIPRFGTSSNLFSIVTWVIIGIVFLILVGIVTYFIARRLKFNKKIIIFEKINNRFEPVMKDRAIEMKMNKGGDTIFYLRKSKRYVPTPSLQTGRRTYWFWKRSDNELINFAPGDFDADAKKLHADFLDKEMRYARTQIQRGLKERYDAPGFWKQYGLLVMGIIYLVIIGLMAWLLFREFINLASSVTTCMNTATEVLEHSERVLGALDSLQQGGSGLRPA